MIHVKEMTPNDEPLKEFMTSERKECRRELLSSVREQDGHCATEKDDLRAIL